MARQKESLTLSVPPGTKEKLEEIARQHDILWGESPSASGLVTAIAQNQLKIVKKSLTEPQIKALRQAVKALIDVGQIEEAKSIITLLLIQGDTEAPLRQALLQQHTQSIQGWRDRVDEFIENKQPFRLQYRNSQKQELEFTVRYAEVIFYEKRFYLQVWCEETADALATTPDLPEVAHNRCFRFDRIESIEPISGEWRGEFDYIKVYLHLQGWLANAYEPKLEDIENTVLGEVRQVVRRVVNPFWLIREVFRYGEDCIIVSPDSVRDRFIKKLQSLNQRYGLTE